jgi:hypothetical protein
MKFATAWSGVLPETRSGLVAMVKVRPHWSVPFGGAGDSVWAPLRGDAPESDELLPDALEPASLDRLAHAVSVTVAARTATPQIIVRAPADRPSVEHFIC